MRIICAASSIEFNCEYFSGEFNSPETFHPIFSFPQKKLLGYTKAWASGQVFSSVESYLLFLALLKSSDLVQFRTSVKLTEKTSSIVANNMELLEKAVIKLNAVPHASKVFPRFVISKDSRDLANIRQWIKDWEDAFKDHKLSYVSPKDFQKLQIRERALERMIKNPYKDPGSYGQTLGLWAEEAGSFPQNMIFDPKGKKVTIAEYWKGIIIKCSKLKDDMYAIPDNDLQELYDHCLENIEMGTIFSRDLYQVLTKARDKKKNYLGLGDLDIPTDFRLLDTPRNAEESAMLNIILSAPVDEPKREDYAKSFDFLKARMAWKMSQRFISPPTNVEGDDDDKF